jgi:hypothetical protein
MSAKASKLAALLVNIRQGFICLQRPVDQLAYLQTLDKATNVYKGQQASSLTCQYYIRLYMSAKASRPATLLANIK